MLTDRQRRFIDLYTAGPRGVQGNATRSAEAAGYAWPGKQGPRLMTMPAVSAPIEARIEAELAAIRAEHQAYIRSLGTPGRCRRRS